MRAATTTPGHQVRYAPGSINVPVYYGGVVIQPGDAIIGFSDGVMTVAQDHIQAVLDRLTAPAGHSRTVEILNAGGTVGQSLGVREKFLARSDIVWE